MSSPIYLSRLVPNIRSREARRDLADCVAMHRTLMNTFPDGLSSNGAARSEAGLLYRVEADRRRSHSTTSPVRAATRVDAPAAFLAAASF
jgi:hypothetical protein